MKVYIAGPMTGKPMNNIPEFDRAADALRERGWDVVSPAELDDPEDRGRMMLDEHGYVAAEKWGECLGRDITIVADCDAVAVLPGWEKSNGAKLEVYCALVRGLSIFTYFPEYRDVVLMRAYDALKMLYFNTNVHCDEVTYDEA